MKPLARKTGFDLGAYCKDHGREAWVGRQELFSLRRCTAMLTRARSQRPRGLSYDPTYPSTLIQIIERICIDPSTRLPFRIQDWQKFIIYNVCGFYIEHEGIKTPYFKEAYIEVAKKNGKSTLMALIVLAKIALSKVSPASSPVLLDRVFVFASKKEQANLIVNRAKEIVDSSPSLQPHFESRTDELRTLSPKLKKSIYSSLRALTSNARREDGQEPTMVVCDEFHAQKKRRYYAWAHAPTR